MKLGTSPRVRLVLVLAVALILASMAGTVAWHRIVWPAGPELELEDGLAYGYSVSRDVGVVFTDGITHVNVSPDADGPIRLIAATPLMDDGGAAQVLGVLVRVMPEMLPAAATDGWFQVADGFPPTEYSDAGGVPLAGLEVHPPRHPGDVVSIEIQVGYEVVSEGRSARHGIELVYEYQGRLRKALLPSYLAICAPAGAECPHEYAD